MPRSNFFILLRVRSSFIIRAAEHRGHLHFSHLSGAFIRADVKGLINLLSGGRNLSFFSGQTKVEHHLEDSIWSSEGEAESLLPWWLLLLLCRSAGSATTATLGSFTITRLFILFPFKLPNVVNHLQPPPPPRPPA